MHHTPLTLKSTFQHPGTPAERFASRERERRRQKREEVRALSSRDTTNAAASVRAKSRDRRESSSRRGDWDDNNNANTALIVRQNSNEFHNNDDSRSHRARSTSRPQQQRIQGNLNERRRIGCLGSSTDRTFRPRGAAVLGPPMMIGVAASDNVHDNVDNANNLNDPRRGRQGSVSRSKSRGNASRGKSVTRSSANSVVGTTRARSQSRTTQSRARSKSRGPSGSSFEMKRSSSKGHEGRSQSRGGRTIDDHLSRPRSQSRGRRDNEEQQTLSSKKSSRSKSRTRKNNDEGTVKSSKSIRSKSRSRDQRDENTIKKSSKSRSQSKGRDASTVVTSRSSKSQHRSSATVASSSSGWKRFIPDSNFTHYSGSSGKFSGGTEDTSPLSYYKEEQQQPRHDSRGSSSGGGSIKKKEKKKKSISSVPLPPPSEEVHQSTTYNPDSESIVTNLYDRTGHCVRHPHVRLRKKKLWGGGWNILITNCPDCCLEEMGRLVRVQKEREGGGAAASVDDDGVVREKKEKKKSSKNERRASQSVHPSSNQDYHEARSVRSSKSSRKFTDVPPQSFENDPCAPIFEFDIPLEEQPGNHPASYTSPKSVKSRKSVKSSAKSVKSSKSTKTSKSAKTQGSKSSKGARRKSKKDPEDSERRNSALSAASPSVAARVANMPYTDSFGCPGKYTGEVNSFGQPHGKGILRYDDGGVSEGNWLNGQHNPDERDCGRSVSNRSMAKSVSNRSVSNKSQSNKSVSGRSVSGRSVSNRSVSDRSRRSLSKSPGRNRNPHQQHQPHPYHQPQHQNRHITQMPWSDVNGFSGHYTGEVNENNAPEGQGYMEYSNGVVEEGIWRNGVFQPPLHPLPPIRQGGNVPSSSMSVWSLRSTPNMGNNNYDMGGHGGGGRAGSVYGGMRY